MSDAHDPAQQWQRNKHSLMVDVGLGALFFITGSLTDHLVLPALVTAGAGLCVVVAQRFVKVDLLGGLALFGVLTLLVSAGFALAFQDDWAVKMRGRWLVACAPSGPGHASCHQPLAAAVANTNMLLVCRPATLRHSSECRGDGLPNGEAGPNGEA